jgi:hypothetical protein
MEFSKSLKSFFILITFVSLFYVGFSTTDILTCKFFKGECPVDYSPVIYGNNFFINANNNLISSPAAISYDKNYNRSLCCKVNVEGIDNVKFNAVDINSKCDGQEIMYFTDSLNARVAIPKENIIRSNVPNVDLNMSNYKYKLCVQLPQDFSSLDIFASTDKTFEYAGYKCLFKTNNIVNGLISDCNAKYKNKAGDEESYNYTIWYKLWENKESLKCNADCTSKLDGRVYSDCGSKIVACKNVPSACDGAIYGSWVPLNSYTEFKCAEPWNQTRLSLITNKPLSVTSVSSESSKCKNVITKTYPVIVDDVLVNMKILICGDN